jgi:ATP-dependent DNA helicase RecQ
MADIHQLLKKYFGYDQFRPLQQNIIQWVIEGKDTLALLPTGGGKSVCYQIPALAQDGICLVITPLIALMKDQVNQLKKRNISALSIYGGMSFFEVKKALENATTGHFKFLYVSPERLQTRLFKEYLPAIPVNLIAVDEAHCISQWGYDFRPPYLKIADIREEMPRVPILALTASATQDVQDDICEKLHFKKHVVFRQSFEKANLSFSAFNTPHKITKLVEILRNVSGTALVYVRNRRRTKEIANLLRMEGMSASYYNAGLTNDERNLRQEDWIANKVRVMVCTNAFGMGIDKPDVRTVVHMDIPDCIESYYQEAGRAGRDAKKAYAVLLYTHEELKDLELLPEKKFPPIDDIRKVYQAICNYLQMPVGTGQGQYFDFNLAECCDRFKLDASLMMNSLSTLAQAGYISFSETVFIQSKVEFTVNKENLYRFEIEQPSLEPIIKALLRTYEGIFDNAVNITEKTIARIVRKDEAEVVRQLTVLKQYRIIDYQPKKDTPQLFFLYDRISAAQITIDAKLYEKRKQQYRFKIMEMIRYTANQRGCRSELLRKYFGDNNTKPCGICDVCLQKKATQPSKETIEKTAKEILSLLPQFNTLADFQIQTKSSKYIVELALQMLTSEEKIVWDGEGKFKKTAS